jgi:hypothetical protein
MPIHARSMRIITKRTDLLMGTGMPQCLADLCAHILALRAILAQWQDDPNYVPQVPAYPSRELRSYLEHSFSLLKKEQIRLIRATSSGTREYSLGQPMPEIEFISDRWGEIGDNNQQPVSPQGSADAESAMDPAPVPRQSST